MTFDVISMGVGLAVGAMAFAGSPKKGKRRTKPRAPEARPLPTVQVSETCSEWVIPHAWIVSVAEPRFRMLLETMGPLAPDPVRMTYQVLANAHACAVPLLTRGGGDTLDFRQLQSDNPAANNFYPHGAILGLYGHVFEAVRGALRRYEQTGDLAQALLFPLEEV